MELKKLIGKKIRFLRSKRADNLSSSELKQEERELRSMLMQYSNKIKNARDFNIQDALYYTKDDYYPLLTKYSKL